MNKSKFPKALEWVDQQRETEMSFAWPKRS